MDDRRARAEAIEGFAEVLRELRASVGNPPFREMSGRSGAISHTTLHEAAKGNRLPSWETTVEFVKACGADPAAYRERWEKANRAVRRTGAGEPPVGADAPAARPSAGLETPAAGAAERRTVHVVTGAQASGPSGGTPASAPVPPPRSGGNESGVRSAPPSQGRRKRPNRLVAAGLVTAVVGVGAAVLAVTLVDRGSDDGEPGPSPSGSLETAAAPSPHDCPVRPSNPAAAPPAHEGDAAEFIADITLPDCTRVGVGETVAKVWRLKNAGTVPWKGYSLHRLESSQGDRCQTISDVPIKDTPPGRMVDIRAEVTTPRQPGFCYVRFKMVDASGNVAFPGNRPVNFQIIVARR